jgi:hypothetical protein
MYYFDTSMADPPPFRRPIRWKNLRADEAERIIRERAADRSNVIFSDHAFDRVEERSILSEDVYRILETGSVEGAPTFSAGEWKAVMVKRMPGTRRAGVVTVFWQNRKRYS